MAISTYLGNLDLDARYGSGAPTNTFIALSTANPTADASGLAEPEGASYERLSVTNNVTNWPAAAGASKENGVDFTFAAPSGSWGTITHFAIFDAGSGGNMLDFGELTTPRAIDAASDPVRFAAGALVITRA